MQVWLDEAKLKFDHADGASGGCFNLAMYCQGMTGKQIADNWRNLDPAAGVSLNYQQYLRLFFAKSLFTMDAYRAKVFTRWGLDWNKIRASSAAATFNMYNFSKHHLEVVQPARWMKTTSVPRSPCPCSFPRSFLNGDTHIDAVYVTDANLEEAIRRGADELWVIWTVSELGEWNDGFVNDYFQIIEAAANGRLRQIEDRIAANNDAIAAGKPGEFGRPDRDQENPGGSRAQLPGRFQLGPRRRGRQCRRANGTAVVQGKRDSIHTAARRGAAAGRFAGHVAAIHRGDERFPHPRRGRLRQGISHRQGRGHGRHGASHDQDRRCRTASSPTPSTSPRPAAISRAMRSAASATVEQGIFNLFVDNGNPDRKAMYYRLFFRDAKGNPLTLIGFKDVRGDNDSDVWTDTTTLFTRILKGHVGAEADGGASILAAGIIHIHFLDFLDELTTFRVEGASIADRASSLESLRIAVPEQTVGRLRPPRPALLTVLRIRAADQKWASGPVHSLGEQRMPFDVIIIGSGFGGAITACRLSQAGYKRARPRARPALG